MRKQRTIWLLLALLLSSAPAFGAEPEETTGTRERVSSEILLRGVAGNRENGGFGDYLERIEIRGSSGLRYRQPFRLGNRPLELRLLGPRIKLVDGKALGMRFEIRF